MAKQDNNIPIDEDFMKEIISQGLPPKQQSIQVQTEFIQKEEIQEIPQETKSQKRKKNNSEDYKEMFFKRIELIDRQPLYVSRATHEKLSKIVSVIGGRKATVSSYVENIIRLHFEHYQDEINERYQQQFEKPL
jgi:hypothetical protein